MILYTFLQVDEMDLDSHASVTTHIYWNLQSAQQSVKDSKNKFLKTYGEPKLGSMDIIENSDSCFDVQDSYGAKFQAYIVQQEI